MAYEYDAYGRPQGNGEPDYFESNQPVSDYPDFYLREPSNSNPSWRQRDAADGRHRLSPSINDRMAAAPSAPEFAGLEGVSPELVAAITQIVKKDIMEHLKQTNSVDDQPKASSMHRAPSNKSSSTSSPPPTTRRVYTPPSPIQPVKMNPAQPTMESSKSPPSSPLEKPTGVRFSDRALPTRPSGGRSFSNMELSTIDQKWGRLFDNDGTPTKRLGQFLRGLANHIIDDFVPKKSIVVTPSKMAAYYQSHALDKEPHPLLTIFRVQSNEQIARLYQDLGCQHHLVQEDSHSPALIPSLTPVGFAHWMTIHILAYPEEEARRLEKVVIAMPIDADGDLVDGKPERLPKQISRHLLPDREDRKTRKLVDSAIMDFLDDLGTASRRKASITSPSLSRRSSNSQSRSRPVDIHQSKTSPTTSKGPPLERERKPYMGAPSETSSNEETIKIERDRQPYTAKEGSGKVHADPSSFNVPLRPTRSNSTTTRTATSIREQPENIEARHHRTQSSTTGQNYVPLSRPGGRRPSSPPLKSFSRSSPEDIQNIYKYGANPSSSSSSFSKESQTFNPGSIGSTGSFPPPPGPPPIDIRERDKRTREDRYRRGPDDDIRFTGEFNSPRDAEKWDRYQETRADPDRFEINYDRGSVPMDPRDIRGAPVEEWYREKGRAGEYDAYGRRYA